MTLQTGTFLGPYEIVSPIASGGMGDVYRARDARLGRDIAIKILARDLAEESDARVRFEREARAVAALSHPNVLAIHDFGNQEGIAFVVTELLEGETLRARILKGPVAWRTAAEIGAAIADGLAAAHAKGIIHRDIKPENVFITADGRVKILDFGLARTEEIVASEKRASEPTTPTTKIGTETGSVMGTLGYIAPEQLNGLSATPASDIFALGCLLYEMVIGKPAFLRDSVGATLTAILQHQPSDLRQIGAMAPDFERVVVGCLEKNPEDRFQSARDLSLTLRSLSSNARLSSDAIPLPKNKRKRAKKAIGSVAVLPFDNGSDQETEYLGDGLTESIINRLSQLPKLRVMARSTVFRLKGRDLDPLEVGRELDVEAVAMGRVRHVGDALVIKIELVDTRDGSHVWGEEYHRNFRDIFAVQDEISRDIADKLRLRLTGEEKKKLARRHTESTEVYQSYLRGRFAWNKRSEEGLRKSIEHFEHALELDPGYAPAWAGLADSYLTLATNIPLPPRDTMPKAKASALRAIAIDDSLAEAHASLASVMWWHDWDWSGAEKEYRRAIELDKNHANAHHGLCMLLSRSERFEEATEEIRKAQKLDPLSLAISVHKGWPAFFSGDYETAVSLFQKALDLDPHFLPAHGWLGMAYEQKGMYAEAIQLFEEALAINRIPIFTSMLAHARALAGETEEARRLLDELERLSLRRYISAYDFAAAYTALGDTRKALAYLDKAFDERSAWLVLINVDPRLRPLRGNPQFDELLAMVCSEF